MGDKIESAILKILTHICGTAVMLSITLGTVGLAIFFIKWILILLGVI